MVTVWPQQCSLSVHWEGGRALYTAVSEQRKEAVTIARSAEEGTQELTKSSPSLPWQHTPGPASHLGKAPSLGCSCRLLAGQRWADALGQVDFPHVLFLFCCGGIYLPGRPLPFPNFLTLCFSSHFCLTGSEVNSSSRVGIVLEEKNLVTIVQKPDTE